MPLKILLKEPALLVAVTVKLYAPAVVGVPDADQLVKPKAYVVCKSGQSATTDELKAHVKQYLAPYKYPRWIEFVSELPKTATGKIQRFKLRQSQ